jgi:hypothetical protein
VYGDIPIDDYGPPENIKAEWRAYHHTQSGDPAKLGKVLVQLAGMDAPPKQFFAGSDAIGAITADLEARLREVQAHKDLSVSTDGNFQGERT